MTSSSAPSQPPPHHHYNHHHRNLNSTSRLSKMNSLSLPPAPSTITTTNTTNPNPNPPTIPPSPDEIYLSKSTHLTSNEVLRRRSHRLKQLSKCYRDYYWILMEELKFKYRQYVWKYGLSPFKEDHQDDNKDTIFSHQDEFKDEGIGETNNNNNSDYIQCAFNACNTKAMALTSFCQLHILSDNNQHLYVPCDYVVKSVHTGPLTCGKPILRSTVPSYCDVHLLKAQKHGTRALKNAGLNVSSSNMLAPKLHILVSKYVREIQEKRRAASKANGKTVVPKLEHGS